jgi:hypothetical protein
MELRIHLKAVSAADEELYDRRETLHWQYQQDISPKAPVQILLDVQNF